MFQDEASFGRINNPKYCRCEMGIRTTVPCHHICEYRYVFGSVEPLMGENFFPVMPYCNTICMNVFLEKLSEKYAEDTIILICDGASWHKSNALVVPENIIIFHILPYMPEMNPIEQIWKEFRQVGFRIEIFKTLSSVVDRLCDVVKNLQISTVKSITLRHWILQVF
jgi:putative transposase